MTTANRVCRSMLFVPGSRPELIAKAAVSEADQVCLDLEDAVAVDQKEASRGLVIRALSDLDFGQRTRILRINGLETPFAYRDLIEVVEAAGDAVDQVMLPKATGAREVEFLDTLLSQIELRLGLSRRIGLAVQIETAGGFVRLAEIARASTRIEALIFGSGDYSASMGMPLATIGGDDPSDADYPGHRWHAAMHAIVAHARAHGLAAIDGPYADFQDPSGLERACRIARAMGFDGKQCIHPRQLAAVNQAFTPAPAEVERARGIVAAYEKAVAEGRGAVAVEGRMIDAANIRMAETVLRAARQIEARGAHR